MDPIATLLRSQISDCMDIDKLLVTLEEERSLQYVHDAIQKVFNDTSSVIFKEFQEKSTDASEEDRLNKYHSNNLALFKNKLVMIVQMIIENVYNSTVAKGAQRDKSDSVISNNESLLSAKEIRQETEDNIVNRTLNFNNVESTPKVKRNIEPSPSNASSNKKTKNVSNTYVLRADRGNKVKRQDLYQTDVKSFITPKKNRVSSPSSQNTSIQNSKPNSKPLTPMASTYFSPKQGSKNMSFHERSLTNLNSTQSQTFLQQSQTMIQQQSQQSLKNLSMISTKTHRSPTRSTTLPVQSEFNHVRGHASFSRDPRHCWVDVVARTDSPGPAHYDPKLRSRSPSISIGKGPRECWVDVVAKTESPGPGRYNPVLKGRSISPSIPRAVTECWVDVVARTDSPGPAFYSPRSRGGSPSISMGKAEKKSWVDIVARTESPGPARYYASMHCLSK